MTLILTNEEIESIFTLEECFNALEPALRDLGNGQAVNMPRQDLLVPGPLENSYTASRLLAPRCRMPASRRCG
jgi:ornithine cyclodeaminase/alanine dehydrogenase-like protein (mu-crystallin family)